MPSPSVVVFDLGKVLVDFDYSIAGRRIASRSNRAVNPVRFFADHSAVLIQYELGLITTRQFFDEIRAVTGFRGDLDEFGESFSDIFAEIPAMVALHAALRQKGFPTYAFSNTNELAIGHIQRRFPFFAHFDGYIYSYEHGAMKPDVKLYEVVERETKRRGKEILYLDDRPENVAAGAARGWQSLLHESPEKTAATLKKLGLLDHASPAG